MSEEMTVREAAVAGQFYAGTRESLIKQIESCYEHPLGPGAVPSPLETPLKRPCGFVVPHAGYVYSGPVAAHAYAAMHNANQLAVVGRLDDAAAQIANGTEQARRERNAMALDIWTNIDAWVHLAAGRLSAARAATESLPPPQPTGATELNMLRMVILAEVAARTDDRNLLQQMANDVFVLATQALQFLELLVGVCKA